MKTTAYFSVFFATILFISCSKNSPSPSVITKGKFIFHSINYSGKSSSFDKTYQGVTTMQILITDSATNSSLTLKGVPIASSGDYVFKEYKYGGPNDLILEMSIISENVVYSSIVGGQLTKTGSRSFTFSCPLEVEWGTGSGGSYVVTGSGTY